MRQTTTIIVFYLALGIATLSCVSSGASGSTGSGASGSTGSGASGSTGSGASGSTGSGAPCFWTWKYPGPLDEDGCPSVQCTPCSSTSGSVCDQQGNAFASQCAALAAGVDFADPCGPPGTVPCTAGPPGFYGSAFCDPTTEVCVTTVASDCPGYGPAYCTPLVGDGGAPDDGDGG